MKFIPPDGSLPFNFTPQTPEKITEELGFSVLTFLCEFDIDFLPICCAYSDIENPDEKNALEVFMSVVLELLQEVQNKPAKYLIYFTKTIIHRETPTTFFAEIFIYLKDIAKPFHITESLFNAATITNTINKPVS